MPPVDGAALAQERTLADVVAPAAAVERRWFIRGALGAAAGAVLLTVGQTLRPLEPLALLANAMRPRLR